MTNEKSELKSRVEAKVKELEAKIAQLQADGKAESNKQMEELKAKKAEVQNMVSSGWDQLTEDVAGKINTWLKNNQ